MRVIHASVAMVGKPALSNYDLYKVPDEISYPYLTFSPVFRSDGSRVCVLDPTVIGRSIRK